MIAHAQPYSWPFPAACCHVTVSVCCFQCVVSVHVLAAWCSACEVVLRGRGYHKVSQYSSTVYGSLKINNYCY